ncbi:zinc finger BED domain-containing protein RICESLEEPER 2-like [Nicotiana tomentosiformis]|uniref:zinc finger BED domain-containing protein RICESLEEPER 2-like n=1 Tax=Nicotiana tomentosiformis TaxID=4098 RepID=UPI00388C73C6
MAENKSRVSEDGDTNDSIPNIKCLSPDEAPNKRKVMQPRSDAWNHLRIIRGDDIAEVITNCLLDWGLENVFTITVDNASSNDVTVREVSKQLTTWGTHIMNGKHLHMRCMDHILNLIVQDRLKEIGVFIKRVRQAVRYIRQSPARIQWMEHEDASLKEMANKINEKIINYWGEPEKMNKIIFIASILDPRNKLDYVPFAIMRMFGEKEEKKLILKVKNYMDSLFDYYVKISSKRSTSASSVNTTNTVRGYGSFLKRGTMRTKLEFERHKEVTGGLDAKSELDRYLAEDIEPEIYEFKILKCWKINVPRFSILAEMARDVLAIPISSVASECAFSTGGRILDSFRSPLTPKLVQSLICLQD